MSLLSVLLIVSIMAVATAEYDVNVEMDTPWDSSGTPQDAPADDVPLDAPADDVPLDAPADDVPLDAPADDVPLDAPVEAPLDAPVDADVPVDAPVDEHDVMQIWCESSADCRLFGDANASCEANAEGLGVCVCGSGYVNPVIDGVTAYVCLLPGQSTISVTASLQWRIASCSVYDESFASSAAQLLQAVLGGVPSPVLGKCGSLTALASVDGVVPTKLLTDMRSAIGTALQNGDYGAVNALGVPDSASVVAGSGSCTVANAIRTALDTTGTCNAVTCSAGYHVAKASSATTAAYVCVADTSRALEDDDDDLTGGGIAGIVIGCVLFVGIIAAIIVYCLCIRDSSSSSRESDEEHEPAYKA